MVVGFTIRELKGYGEMPLAALLSCQLKNLELLDSSSELDLFSLHYVFVPKINKHLNIWKDGWVNHKLSSEAQYTPLHLFISRMLDDDYQNGIFQENVLVSYKFQLIIFTYFPEKVPTY